MYRCAHVNAPRKASFLGRGCAAYPSGLMIPKESELSPVSRNQMGIYLEKRKIGDIEKQAIVSK